MTENANPLPAARETERVVQLKLYVPSGRLSAIAFPPPRTTASPEITSAETAARPERVKGNPPVYAAFRAPIPYDGASFLWRLTDMRNLCLRHCWREDYFRGLETGIFEFGRGTELPQAEAVLEALRKTVLRYPFSTLRIFRNPEGRVAESIILADQKNWEFPNSVQMKYDLIERKWYVEPAAASDSSGSRASA